RLNNPLGACPPDGFRYVFPEDGYQVHAWTYVDWIDNAKRHLIANNKQVPADLEAQMQSQLCHALPPGWCEYGDPLAPRPSSILTWDDVASGVKTFSRWIMGGAKYVPQTEAERRAEICSRCYLNVNVQGCTGCQEIVQNVVRNKKTKLDAVLRACAVCKCLLAAKVHF